MSSDETSWIEKSHRLAAWCPKLAPWQQQMLECVDVIEALPLPTRKSVVESCFAQWQVIAWDEEYEFDYYEPSSQRLHHLCNFISESDSPLASDPRVIGGLASAICSGGVEKLLDLWEEYLSFAHILTRTSDEFPIFLVAWEFNNFLSRGRSMRADRRGHSALPPLRDFHIPIRPGKSWVRYELELALTRQCRQRQEIYHSCAAP